MDRINALHWMERMLIALCGIVLLGMVAEYGYHIRLPLFLEILLRGIGYVALLSFVVQVVLGYAVVPLRWGHFKHTWPDLLIVLWLVLALNHPSVPLQAGLIFVIVRQMVAAIQMVSRTRTARQLLVQLERNPAQLLALSFLGVILVGTLLLTFPSATQDGKGTPLLNALFTATSATCVTGLIVVDTPSYFSRFGQVVILCLIQVGGLGIMTLSTSMALILGRRIGFRRRAVMQDILDQTDTQSLRGLVVYIVKMTFIAELIGGVVLFIRWYGLFDEVGRTAYLAIFHAVSAFCNAGFSLFSDSLMGFVGDPVVNLVMSTLIIVGGIGFVVVGELMNREVLRRGWRYSLSLMSLHTRLVLLITGLLIGLGTLFVFFFEFDYSMLDLSLGQKLWAAYFQSVTPRTAGFNTIDFSHLKDVTLFLMVLFMFIGASPGSTGGGIKTSTLGVLVYSVRAMLEGRDEVEAFGKSIPKLLVYKSIAIMTVSSVVVIFFFALLLITQKEGFLDLLFETVSAFGTVGLSTGVTPRLTGVGKLIIIGLMFVGRIGPLTLALAVRERREKGIRRYPSGRVMVG